MQHIYSRMAHPGGGLRLFATAKGGWETILAAQLRTVCILQEMRARMIHRRLTLQLPPRPQRARPALLPA